VAREHAPQVRGTRVAAEQEALRWCAHEGFRIAAQVLAQVRSLDTYRHGKGLCVIVWNM